MAAKEKRRFRIEIPMLFGGFSLVLGMLLGWISVDLPTNFLLEKVLLGIGIFIFVGSLIGYFSPTAICSSVNLFALFFGRLAGIYLCRTVAILAPATRPYLYFAAGTTIMLLIGFMIWHTRLPKWAGAFCGSIPIALLISEAFSYYDVWFVGLVMDVVFAGILYVIFYDSQKRLMSLPFIIFFTFIIVIFEPLERLFGGVF